MPRLPINPSHRGQISLSALLIIQCLLILAMGPFQVAKAYLRTDSALHLAKLKLQYLAGVTHSVRRQFEPGTHQFEFEGTQVDAKWVKIDQVYGTAHHVRVKAERDSGWPTMVSVWIQSPTRQFEIRGQYEDN